MNQIQDEHDTNVAKTEEFLKEILAAPTGGVHQVPDCYGTRNLLPSFCILVILDLRKI